MENKYGSPNSTITRRGFAEFKELKTDMTENDNGTITINESGMYYLTSGSILRMPNFKDTSQPFPTEASPDQDQDHRTSV